MKPLRLTLSALVLSALTSVSVAQSVSDHNAHHPADALTKSEAPIGEKSPTADAAPLLNQMDAHMENMQRFHQKFENASPDERRALMTEHHAMMQKTMKLMGTASNHSGGMSMMNMSGMKGPGMMGGMDPDANQSATPGPQMAQGMMQHHELMSKRMDMMQSMLQMMMDRMDAEN
ncbi:hypothetical protein [Alcaligenes phenolicus]|uniref:DUF305 domain-containing protein n=1 Tax=Alcaligenes phenolicus TaxID=232846 RepID=A0AAW5W0B6_9BURK|nr:hypothetical protein [Alcaligenes phenolicus]MCX5565837.1 hypothetical protein [Alcaligenes phenolicus]